MWSLLPAGTHLYRVTREEDVWSDVVGGLGSYYGEGGRYNIIFQQTVYASADPLVAIREFGWHQSLSHCDSLALSRPLEYPLATAAKLWRFRFDSDIQLIDICSPQATVKFGYPAHMPYNWEPHHVPKKEDGQRLTASQQLANRIRHSTAVPKGHDRPEGLIAPSVRSPHAADYQPKQVVLFVIQPHSGLPRSLQDRAVLSDEWRLELEFLTPDRAPVAVNDEFVAWMTPRFRLAGNASPVPRFATRPGSKALPVNKWHTLDIRYSPY